MLQLQRKQSSRGDMTEEEEKLSLVCIICDNRYDDTGRRPMVLLCGHTFCKECVTKFFEQKGYLQCLVCRRKFQGAYNSVQEVGTNIDICRIVSQIKDQKKKGGTLMGTPGGASVRPPNACKVHPKAILDLYCLQCDVAICSQCMLKDHRTHDVITEEELSIRESLFDSARTRVKELQEKSAAHISTIHENLLGQQTKLGLTKAAREALEEQL